MKPRAALLVAAVAAATVASRPGASVAFEPELWQPRSEIGLFLDDQQGGRLFVADTDEGGRAGSFVLTSAHVSRIEEDPLRGAWNLRWSRFVVAGGSGFLALSAGDSDGDGRRELVVLDRRGGVLFLDPGDGSELGRAIAPGATLLVLADIEPDPGDEILALGPGGLEVRRRDQPDPLWTSSLVAGALTLVCANVDLDPAPELLFGFGADFPGLALDAATHAVEWVFPDGFGTRLLGVNLNADPRDEIVTGGAGTTVIDGASRSVLWQAPASPLVGVFDFDDDGDLDVLSGGPTGVEVLDGATGAALDSFILPRPGADYAGVAELGLDCGPELYRFGGWPVDIVSLTTSRSLPLPLSAELPGPTGIAVGDLDGDGTPVLVFTAAAQGFSRVVEATDRVRGTRRELFREPGPQQQLGAALALAQLDADPQLEILTTVLSPSYRPTLQARDSRSGDLAWEALLPGSGLVTVIHAFDLDGDARPEIVYGHSCCPTSLVRVLDGGDGHLIQELFTGSPADSVHALALGDVDGDGSAELIAGLAEGFHVLDAATRSSEWIQPLASLRAVALGDVDGDGILDVLTGNADGRIEAWSAVRRASLWIRELGPGSIVAATAADLDGDGAVELVVTQDRPPRLRVLDVRDATPLGEWPGVGADDNLVAGDLDGNGRVDLAIGTSSGVRVFEYGARAADLDPPIFNATPGLTWASADYGPGCCPRVHLAWNEARDILSPPVRYLVYRSSIRGIPPGPSSLVADLSAMSFEDSSLAPNRLYHYVVRARDAAGNEDSNEIEATVATPPADVTPPDQGNVLRLGRRGDAVEIRFTGARARLFRIYRNLWKGEIGATGISPVLDRTLWTDFAVPLASGPWLYSVRGLSPCSLEEGP